MDEKPIQFSAPGMLLFYQGELNHKIHTRWKERTSHAFILPNVVSVGPSNF